MNVTVFGGAQPQPGDPSYQEAMRLGRMLGEAGHTILTGGYRGTMEAVSHGACEAGSHVIGITCKEIETWRNVEANPWVKEERRFATLRERLFALIDNCDAAMALPGGAGTLAEIALTWNQMIIGSIPVRPLILIGQGWQTTFVQFFQSLDDYIAERDRQHLIFVPDVETAVQELNLLMEKKS